METVNQVLITLKEADGFARSENPHHHRLALVLLDNVVELQLRRKAESAFAFDRTTWFSGVRLYDRKRRKKVSREHAELLSLAVDESLITAAEARLVSYAHRVRNQAYHVGEPQDKLDMRLAITLLYRFIRDHFPKWRNARFGLALTPRPPVPIEEARSDKTGWSPLLFGSEEGSYPDFQSAEHWTQILGRCMTFDDSIDLRPLIKQRIENLLDGVEESIHQLTEYDDTNFVPVLAQRFTVLSHVFCCCETVARSRMGPVAALNIYLAVLDSEERLLDIADEEARAKEFHKLLDGHKFDRDVISSLQLDKFREFADTVSARPEHEGITEFLEIGELLEQVAYAAKECASDLDGYVQFQIDEMRGK